MITNCSHNRGCNSPNNEQVTSIYRNQLDKKRENISE